MKKDFINFMNRDIMGNGKRQEHDHMSIVQVFCCIEIENKQKCQVQTASVVPLFVSIISFF